MITQLYACLDVFVENEQRKARPKRRSETPIAAKIKKSVKPIRIEEMFARPIICHLVNSRAPAGRRVAKRSAIFLWGKN